MNFSDEILNKNIHKMIFPSAVNKDYKIIHDYYYESKYKFTREILGELIKTLKIFFENNYNELEQYSKLFWTKFRSIKDQIEEMKSTKSSMQCLLQKYDNINFSE